MLHTRLGTREQQSSVCASRIWVPNPIAAFLVLSFVFGVLFIVCVPPFQSPDEINHYSRAYQVAEGQLFVEQRQGMPGGYLPVAIESAFVRFRPVITDSGNRVTLDDLREANAIRFDGTARHFVVVALYSPVCYVPQIVGISVARALGLSVIQTLYLARVAALLAWILLVCMAIRISPVGKWAIVAVSLLPMSLSLGASITADSFTYGLVALATGMSLKMALQDTPVSRTQIVGAAAVGLLIASTKPPFSLLFMLFLLAALCRRRMRRGDAVIAIASLVLCVGLAAGWSLLSQSGSVPTPGVSPAAQLHMIATHPQSYARALLHTFTGRPPLGLARQVIGQLGIDAKVPLWGVALGWLLIVLEMLAVENELRDAPLLARALAFGFVAVLFILIPTSLYLSAHQVGFESTIEVQGRYFIPLLLTLIPLMAMRKGPVVARAPQYAVSIMAAQTLILASAIWVVLARYYGV